MTLQSQVVVIPLAAGRLTRDWTEESSLRAQTDQIGVGKYDATAETDRQIVARVAELSTDEVAYLEEPYAPHRIVGPQWAGGAPRGCTADEISENNPPGAWPRQAPSPR